MPRLHRRALVQPHCHHHAVCGFDDEAALLERMGLSLQIPDSGCCGMASSFGYEAGERFEVSVAAGERVLLPSVRSAGPDTLIVADGFSCRGRSASSPTAGRSTSPRCSGSRCARARTAPPIHTRNVPSDLPPRSARRS